jgi:hypothetical protein
MSTSFFAGKELFFSTFVRSRPLSPRTECLSDPRLAHRSISPGKFDGGFGDSSYLHRALRRR